MSSTWPLLWAYKGAGLNDKTERDVLMAMVDHGDNDGTNCWASASTLAEEALVDDRTVRNVWKRLAKRGVIRLQTYDPPPARWLAIPSYRRSKIWEAMIPASWWSDEPRVLAEINAARAKQGWPLITPETRPDLAPAPPKPKRSDTGKPNPKRRKKNTSVDVPPVSDTGGGSEAGGVSHTGDPLNEIQGIPCIGNTPPPVSDTANLLYDLLDSPSPSSCTPPSRPGRERDGERDEQEEEGRLATTSERPALRLVRPVEETAGQSVECSSTLRSNQQESGEPDSAHSRRSEPSDEIPPADVTRENTGTPNSELGGDTTTDHREQAYALVDQAAAQWSQKPTMAERERITRYVAQALADGATAATMLPVLTNGLGAVDSVVAVVVSRVKKPGWATVAPTAVSKPKRPDWCGQCDATTRQIEVVVADDDGYGDVKTLPARCPRCHPEAKREHVPAPDATVPQQASAPAEESKPTGGGPPASYWAQKKRGWKQSDVADHAG